MSDLPPPPPDDSGWSSSQPPQPPQPPPPPVSSGPGGAASPGFVSLGNGDKLELAAAGTRLGAKLIDLVIFIAASVAVSFALPVVGPLLVGAAYEIMFVALKGQTPGKMATDIKVVRADNGGLPGWGASAGRWAIPAAGYILAVIPGLLVHASLLWDDRRQGWHDKVVGTLVVKA